MVIVMRRPRDFDAELKALADKAKMLKENKVRRLGELVVATGADALDVETLAGALLAAVETKETATREGWRRRGAAFFQRTATSTAPRDRRGAGGGEKSGRAAPQGGSEAGA